MPKDEKILKKIGKLLTLYGVEDNEKENFLIDLQDKKYDDPDEEEVADEKVETETEESVEEQPSEETKVEEKEESTETEVEETQPESVEEEQVSDEEVANDSEEPQLEETETEEEKVVEEEPFDYKSKFEEQQKVIDGLSARLSSIEDIVSKLGEKVEEEKPIGASPAGNPVDENQDTTFDEINRKRIGY